jgi:hypothetical protein
MEFQLMHWNWSFAVAHSRSIQPKLTYTGKPRRRLMARHPVYLNRRVNTCPQAGRGGFRHRCVQTETRLMHLDLIENFRPKAQNVGLALIHLSAQKNKTPMYVSMRDTDACQRNQRAKSRAR